MKSILSQFTKEQLLNALADLFGETLIESTKQEIIIECEGNEQEIFNYLAS